MTSSKVPKTPEKWESRAFFAAILAASRGDDKAAGDILRSIADRMTSEFLKEGVKHGRKAEAEG